MEILRDGIVNSSQAQEQSKCCGTWYKWVTKVFRENCLLSAIESVCVVFTIETATATSLSNS